PVGLDLVEVGRILTARQSGRAVRTEARGRVERRRLPLRDPDVDRHRRQNGLEHAGPRRRLHIGDDVPEAIAGAKEQDLVRDGCPTCWPSALACPSAIVPMKVSYSVVIGIWPTGVHGRAEPCNTKVRLAGQDSIDPRRPSVAEL